MSIEVRGEVKGSGAGVEGSLKLKDQDALDIVKRNTLWSMGVGLLPMPGLDLIGVTGVQIKMLNELSHLYKVPFSEHRVKSIVTSLFGGLGTLAVAPALFSLVKIIPIVGQTAGLVSVPLSAGAFTYAVGKVFTQHFSSGGTFLDFEPAAVREHFRREFESAKRTVQDLKSSESKS